MNKVHNRLTWHALYTI